MFSSLSHNLYDEVLMNSIKQGAHKISIVTGYSSPAIVHKLFKDTDDKNIDIQIELIIGMITNGLVNSINHRDFLKLQKNRNFKCSYVTKSPPVHAKLYLLENNTNKEIINAYGGSANFSINGLINGQVEIMTAVNANQAKQFIESIKLKSTFIDHSQIISNFTKDQAQSINDNTTKDDTVALTLLNSKNLNETPKRSGINWGQRPDVGREPNQAYINIPAHINQKNFFPNIGIPFIIQTDDNHTLAVVRAQDNGKGLHTYESNALMGKYLRDRLGVNHGAFVTKEHLDQYGRTDVTIKKLDDETYYMDFSVSKKY